MLGERGLAPEGDATGLGCFPPLAGTFYNSLPLIFGHSAEKRDEPAAKRRGQIEVRLVQYLQQR